MTAEASSMTGLVVPIDLIGFCVGPADEAGATASFAGTTVDYSKQTLPNVPAYLGQNVFIDLDQPALQRLEAGVHLHWALPDALTRSTVDVNHTAVSFPAVPNRWLVTRFVIAGADVTPTSWVVESDALNDAAPEGQTCVTIPLQPGQKDASDFAYLGQRTALAAYAPRAEAASTFKQRTNRELSAVSNGVPTFASYYPESRSAFGFCDTLDGVSGTPDLMYVVTGWHGSERTDPATLSTDLSSTHRWATDSTHDYTLYSGTVQGLQWDVNRRYVVDPESQTPISAAAAIGNTPIEALSAYFQQLKHPDIPFFEKVLNAFQQGLLPKLSDMKPGLLPRLAEALHSDQFQPVASSLIYTIVMAEPSSSHDAPPPLPPPLADKLNLLNLASQAYGYATAAAEDFRWRVFADWYRYFLTPPADSGAISNHLNGLYGQWTSGHLTDAVSKAKELVDNTLQDLTDSLKDTILTVKAGPGPRYWKPTDPAVLLASPDLSFPLRYGGDDRFRDDGKLACRSVDALVSGVSVDGTAIVASRFAAACTLTSAALPYASDCTDLLTEACLLNTTVAASLSSQGEAALQSALRDLLEGTTQTTWTVTTGTAPSPVALNWWDGGNPWMPLFLQWTVAFTPQLPTVSDLGLQDYPTDFFTANFEIDPETGSFVRPTSATGGNGPQNWSGQCILSPTAADNLAQAIAASTDGTLDPIRDDILTTPTLVQSLSGFTDQLLMQEHIVNLQIAIPTAPQPTFLAQSLTKRAQQVVGSSYAVAPQFQGSFNPIRAGAFTVSLAAVDVFGQKRSIDLTSVATAESMTSKLSSAAGSAYAAPRLSQPARLSFDWVSADAAGLPELNDHPAATPICGWLLPNHLDGGFFLHDGAGRPLGSLQLNGDQTVVLWQSAPGDDATIDLAIGDVMGAAQPALKALALSLQNAPAKRFLDFWTAVDRVHGGISPSLLAADAGLPVLIGRPVALVQAALRLDLAGQPFLNQSWSCLQSKSNGGDETTTWTDTDAGLSSVQFPVALGDIDQLDDGLIGYFLAGQSGGYDLTTFYTEGADPNSSGGVIQPTQTTILLEPSPGFADPGSGASPPAPFPLLMLVDPRAPVHATTGILPTQTLQIPPDLAADALSTLDMSFRVTPVLSPAGGLAFPVPRVPGYAVSFVSEQSDADGKHIWVTQADIAAPISRAVWDYTPQTLMDGWLRLNPTIIAFEVLNADGGAALEAGVVQAATLRVTNKKPATLTFSPGTVKPEGEPADGSSIFVHFGALVAQDDVPTLTLSAAGWTFTAMNDPTYGRYWAGTPTSTSTLVSGGSFAIAIANIKPTTALVQARVTTDYYGIDGATDGVYADIVSIQS